MSWVLYREVVVPQAVVADQLHSHNFILVLSAICAYLIRWYFSNVIDADQPRHISHLSARFKSLIGQSPGPHITAVRNAAAFVSLVGPLHVNFIVDSLSFGHGHGRGHGHVAHQWGIWLEHVTFSIWVVLL